MPGETIPTLVPESPVASSTPMHHSPSPPNCDDQAHHNIADMLQAFQSSVETHLSSLALGLSSITDRMTKLESQQHALEKEVRGASIKTSASPRKGKRRREVPSALHVCIGNIL